LAIWRPRTLKARLSVGLVGAIVAGGGIYTATTEHLSLRVGAWRDAKSFDDGAPIRGMYDPLAIFERETPAGGGRRLEVDVTITNVGLRETSAGRVRWELVGSDGVVYEAWDRSQIPAMVRRGRVQMNVFFTVPKKVEPRTLRLVREK
jgi:hypothetical protein